ncbi:MAG TPA: thiamine phosphate synthase [Turneriella sp.]|nr:thiamine phosphate synthase [Turneriella sp.]
MMANLFKNAPSSLYLIMDGEACAARGIALDDFLVGALEGGAWLIQYRHKNIDTELYEKNLQRFLPLCVQHHTHLIVNDHAALAEKFNLPLHIGQEDFLPPNLSVPYGRSIHNMDELSTVLSAQPAASYIALGSMFTSPTKPEVKPMRAIAPMVLEEIEVPLVLIGGISLDNASRLPRSERVFYAIITDTFRFGSTRADIRRYVESWHRSASA